MEIDFQSKQGFICDMDGVLYHGNKLLPGAVEFIKRMQENQKKYPHLANRGEVIFPVTFDEHLYGWHGGNFKNSLPGKPVNYKICAVAAFQILLVIGGCIQH